MFNGVRMKKFKCMTCGTKQKIKDGQVKVSFEKDNHAVLWGPCVKCKRVREVVGSDDPKY